MVVVVDVVVVDGVVVATVVVVAVVVATSDGVVSGPGVAVLDDEHPAATLATITDAASRPTRTRTTGQS